MKLTLLSSHCALLQQTSIQTSEHKFSVHKIEGREDFHPLHWRLILTAVGFSTTLTSSRTHTPMSVTRKLIQSNDPPALQVCAFFGIVRWLLRLSHITHWCNQSIPQGGMADCRHGLADLEAPPASTDKRCEYPSLQ